MSKIKLTETNPIVAICYDFDKTLSPNNMQEYGFLPGIGIEPDIFVEQAEDDEIMPDRPDPARDTQLRRALDCLKETIQP